MNVSLAADAKESGFVVEVIEVPDGDGSVAAEVITDGRPVEQVGTAFDDIGAAPLSRESEGESRVHDVGGGDGCEGGRRSLHGVEDGSPPVDGGCEVE